jgi:hypothetical protein
MQWNSQSFAYRQLLQDDLVLKRKADEPIAYTVPGAVVNHMSFERQQKAFRDWEQDFNEHKPFALYEVFESSNDGQDVVSGVCVDIDVKHAPESNETLQDLVRVTKVFWNVLHHLVGPDVPVSVVGLTAWPPYEFTVDQRTKKAAYRPRQLTIFGQPCYIQDLPSPQNEPGEAGQEAGQEALPELAIKQEEQVDLDFYESLDKREWYKPKKPAGENASPAELKVGLHLYAAGRLDVRTGLCQKLFLKKYDLLILTTILHQELDRHLGPREGCSWQNMIVDRSISGLRIPGACKIDTCPGCDPKKRKRDGTAAAKNSNVFVCRECGGQAQVNSGRPYFPIVVIDHEGVVDGHNCPQVLCNNMSRMLEIARLRFYPDYDPPPVKLNIPPEWLVDPENVEVASIFSSATNKARSTVVPGRVTEKARGPIFELSQQDYGSAFQAVYTWLKTQNCRSWRGLTVTKIYMHSLDSENWVGAFVVKPNRNGIYCMREKNFHHRSPIWFKLYAETLRRSHTFLQYCYPCDSRNPDQPAAEGIKDELNDDLHCAPPRKKKARGKKTQDQDQATTRTARLQGYLKRVPGGLCRDPDHALLTAFQRVRDQLRINCPTFFLPKAGQQQQAKGFGLEPDDEDDEDHKGPKFQTAPKSASFVPATQMPVVKREPKEKDPAMQLSQEVKSSQKKRKLAKDMKAMWG